MTEQAKRGPRQVKVGRVLSNRMDKTVVVVVDKPGVDRLYHRHVRRSSKFHAHDESNACAIGDTVQIVATRPLSKTKSWRVSTIVKRAEEN
jgi:small subunit ribosomal protein S17